MALVRAPDERKVVAARMRQVCLTSLQQLFAPGGDQSVHGRKTLADRAFLLVGQQQLMQGRYQPVGALHGRGAIAVECQLLAAL